MSTLENVIIRGNLAVEASPTTADQGFGDVFIERNVAINGPTASTSYTTGALVVTGGIGIAGNLFGNSNLDINGITTLDQTTIDTTDGLFSVAGTNKIAFTPSSSIEMTASATSFFRTSTGNMTVESQTGNTSVLGNTLVSVTSSSGAVNLSAAGTSSYTTSTGNLTIQSSTGVTNVLSSANTNITSSAASVIVNGNAASSFNVTGAFPLSLTSTAGSVILESGKSSTDSIQLNTTAAAGGIDINAGTNGISLDAIGGGISLDAQNTSSNFSLSTNGPGQDLTISVTGVTDSSLFLTSTGTNSDAIRINSSNTSGGIDIDAGTGGATIDTTGGISLDSATTSNFTVTGTGDLTLSTTAGSANLIGGEAVVDAVRIFASDTSGGIDIDAGTGGATIDTTGGISLDSTTASNFTVTGSADLTLSTTAGSANLLAGEAASDAIRIFASNASGGIDMDAGTSGATLDTTGAISLDSAAASNFTVATTSNNQNLTLSVTGATDSKVLVSSSGTGQSAIDIQASAGGINATATNLINIQTTDTVNGVRIGTATSGVPITIGNPTSSTVTIGKDLVVSGNFTVSGTTTTVNTETVTVEDNIVVYNSAPTGTADGGFAVKRFQRSASGGSDDIVSDTPNETSATHGGNTQVGTTASTIILNAGANATNDYYSGWWIKITSGARSGDVRRIKQYNGTTKVATIYATGDTDPSFPGQELNFQSPFTGYDNVSYSLYGNVFIASVYDESSDRWVLASVPLEPAVTAQITPLKYIDIQAGSIYSTGTLNVNTITGFSGTAVTVSGVTINNGALTGVTSINGNTPDAIDTVTLANNTTAVDIPSTTTLGSFILLAEADYAGGPMAIFLVSKAIATDVITPNRITSARGSNNERIDAEWNASQKIRLKFQSIPGSPGSYNFKVKIISP
jgi:hypothetical protein